MQAVTTANFEEEVLSADKPVLVDFWGPQCQPCLALMPAVEELAQEVADQVKVVKVNAREAPRLCINLKVIGLPTFLLFNKGEEVARLSGGDITIGDIREMLRTHLVTQES